MKQVKTFTLQPKDLRAVLDMATAAVKDVSSTLKENYGKTQYTTKAHANDWVTKWDRWAEEQIVTQLERFDSTIGIVAEEGARKAGGGLYWTVDPIDGTAHFVNGEAKCTSMIALVENEVPVAGVIYDFVNDDLYTAATGLGAYRNRQEKLQVNVRELQRATLELNMHLPEVSAQRLQEGLHDCQATLVQNFASGYAGILTATGAIDGMLYAGTKPPCVWDIAPVAILVQEAGGAISNLEDESYRLGGNNFVNGCPQLVESKL